MISTNVRNVYLTNETVPDVTPSVVKINAPISGVIRRVCINVKSGVDAKVEIYDSNAAAQAGDVTHLLYTNTASTGAPVQDLQIERYYANNDPIPGNRQRENALYLRIVSPTAAPGTVDIGITLQSSYVI